MPARQPTHRANILMPIGQHTSLEELFKAAAIELDELKAARFHNFAVAVFAGLGSTA
jgi:hypothetical protein